MRDVLHDAGPFHRGELALQRATGEHAAGTSNGRIIADHVIPQGVGFIARQELAVVATIDGDGRPWSSALVGPPGSFTVPDLTRLALDRAAARTDDPLWTNLHADLRAGLLFIELASRRRYRVNGRVTEPDGDPLVVEIGEALPNCPKYISRRRLVIDTGDTGSAGGEVVETGTDLGDAERRIIAGADSCFVASANPAGLLDSSHRGGRPGFVEWHDNGLWLPDYPGNSMFTTLGNLALHPAAGLLFIDFARSRTLQLTGTTALDLDADAPDSVTGGTHRGWTFTPTAWRRAPLARRLHAEFLELSPFNP